MTKKSIFEMLEGFSKYYDVMSPEDKKALLQAMVSFIELYPEKRDDKHLIKTIHFTFPVTYDGESGAWQLCVFGIENGHLDRKSTRLNSSHIL